MDGTDAAKPVAASQVEMTEIVNPEDTNPLGTIFGGRVMALMDKAAEGTSSYRLSTTFSISRFNPRVICWLHPLPRPDAIARAGSAVSRRST